MDKDLLIAARPAAGFRRCGIHHPPSEVRHPAGTFTTAQVEALKREPNLMVIETEPLAAKVATGGTVGRQEPRPADPTPAAPAGDDGATGGAKGGKGKAARPPAPAPVPPSGEPPAGDPPAG